MPPLTEIKIKSIKPTEKTRRFFDGGGLYLEVTKAGSKYWRWKYRIDGKEKRLAFGVWPEVSLREARDKRDECRAKLRAGEDPGEKKEKGAKFEAIAEAWRKNMGNVWSESHATTVKGRLKLDVYPYIGERPIANISPQDMLTVLRRIENRKAYETASRVMGICSQIFRYGVATGAVTSDPCRDLRGALVPYKKGQFAAITDPEEAGKLMVAIENYKGSGVVRAALKFSALTFCRPGEIRNAEWAEVDMDEATWTIPAPKMKARREHTVPLSTQALDVLREIRPLTGHKQYIFPSPRGRQRPLSENGVNTAIRNMGYGQEQMTAHGFRTMASTLLNELGYRYDVIEAQQRLRESSI